MLHLVEHLLLLLVFLFLSNEDGFNIYGARHPLVHAIIAKTSDNNECV